MRVLDLGCGWGSLSLWIARRFPNCTVVSVSNSNAQRLDIERRCRQEEITNVEVITADVNDFDHGDEWFVAHYLFLNDSPTSASHS